VASIVVENFGDVNANGVYVEVGSHDGQPYYEKITGDYTIIYKLENGPYSFSPAYRTRITNKTYSFTGPVKNVITDSMNTTIASPDFSPVAGSIQDHAFGQSVTTNGGITVRWEPLDGSGSQAWEATTLSYASRYGNDSCP